MRSGVLFLTLVLTFTRAADTTIPQPSTPLQHPPQATLSYGSAAIVQNTDRPTEAMSQPWSPQQPHPLGSHPPRQEDLDAVDKALEILAVDDRTYCDPLFSFVHARIQGLQEVLDVLARSGRWVPALSDEELHALVTGLASNKAPAEVLEEIRRRYVYPRCIKKGQQKAAEESKLGHWEQRAAEMTEFMVGSGHGQRHQPPPASQFFLPAQQYALPAQHQPSLAPHYHLPAQQCRFPPVQQHQPTAALRIGTHGQRDEAVREEEGLTNVSDIEAGSSCSPFPAYEEDISSYACQGLASRGVGTGHQDRQYQPSPTSGTGTHVAESCNSAARKEGPLPNMTDNGTGSPYRAIYVYARGIPNPSPHGMPSERAGGGDHHGQALIPPPPTPTWSESTAGPKTHMVREHSDSLHVDAPSPFSSFFTGPVATAPIIQPNVEKGRTRPRKPPPAPIKLTARENNAVLKNSVQRTNAPRTSVPGTSAPRTSVPGTSAPRSSAPRTSVPKANAPKNSTPKTNVANKSVQRSAQQKGEQKKAIWR